MKLKLGPQQKDKTMWIHGKPASLFFSISTTMTLAVSMITAMALGVTACGDCVASLMAEVMNPGFEQHDKGAVAYWHIDRKIRDKGLIDTVSLPDADGQVLRLRPNSKNVGNDMLGVGQMLDAGKYVGQTINVTARLGADNGFAVVGVHVLGKGDGFDYVQLKQGDSGSKLIDHQATLQVGRKARHIIVYAITNTTSGTAYFDDIILTAGAIPPESNQGKAGDAEPLTGTATVHLDKVVRTIPATLFGTNIEWIFNGQGLWSVKQGTLDPQAVDEIAASGFSLYRFPGGVFSDYYDWHNGIGPHAGRPESRHYPKGPKSENNFGTDELIALADKTGADLLITVNCGHGNPKLAASWVKYLNVDKKQGVDWWEIGNELYMDGDLSGGELDADEYAEKFVKFARAMKGVDPSIKLGAIGGLNYGSYHFIKSRNWTKDVLRKVGGSVDFLAVHNGYAPVLMGGTGRVTPTDVYKAMLAAPLNIEKNLAALDILLRDYDLPERKIKLAITEWGPMFHVLPANEWVDHVKTFGSSLFVAATFNTFLRQPRVEIANSFKLTDYGFMGWLGMRDGRFVPTAPLLAFKLYADLAEGRVLATEVDVPAYGSRAVGVIDSVKRVPYLDIVSVAKGDNLTLMVVNKHFTAPVSMDLHLATQHPYSKVTQTALTAEALDANTGTTLPDIPGLKWAEQVSIARFHQGSPSEIRMESRSWPLQSQSHTQNVQTIPVTFAPMSLTRLSFTR